MNIRPIGKDFEAVCPGCGEVLLLGLGDSVNFRPGPEMDVCGVAIPVPAEILCAACSRRENEGVETCIRFIAPSCSKCGGDLSEADEFEPDFDENGNLTGIVCSGCAEPWRTSCEKD